MQAILVKIIQAAGPAILAAFQPALGTVVVQIIAAAKAKTFPTEFAWAQPIIEKIEAELLAMFPTA